MEPRTGGRVRGRRAAWVAAPRPETAPAWTSAGGGPRLAVTAVTDALTTAFMLLEIEEIAALCERSPGLEAWVLPEENDGQPGGAELLHFGGLHGGESASAMDP